MKKGILSIIMIATITFVACSDEEGSNELPSCVTCEAFQTEISQVSTREICRGENGNAFIDGVDQEINYEEFVTTTEALTTCE